jgi:hypothetical protein
MLSFIGIVICALTLWAFAFFGIKNYEYDHSDNMLTAKIISGILALSIISLAAFKCL